MLGLNISLPALTRALLASRLSFYPYSTAAMGLPAAVKPDTPAVSGQRPAKIHLYTAGTPNGYKVSIGLEELRAAYPDLAKTALSYDVMPINLAENQQKSPEFLKINPNGRIPAIIDDNAGGLNVFETASILLWLGESYDREHKLTFADRKAHATMLSWIMFTHGGVGPMMGQAGVFLRSDKKIPFAIRRYVQESERLFSVLEDGLDGQDYLVENKYSLADINAYPWVSGYYGSIGLDISKFPKVKAWCERIGAREAVKEGLKVPKPRTLPDEKGVKEALERTKEFIRQADEDK